MGSELFIIVVKTIKLWKYYFEFV